MADHTEARMEARVRKYTESISRSLEKICDIIDEHEQYQCDWDFYPEFLRLLPMRYRAGGYVLELTAMDSRDHGAMNTFKFSEVSNALSKAFEQAEDITNALSYYAFNGKKPSNRQSNSGFDDEILKSIMSNMVGSIKAPRLSKATEDCVSVLLQKELQTIVNNKISNANENIGVYDLPEDGRLTRTRSRQSNSTRSDSRDTIAPTSSLEERGTTGDLGPWCEGCFDGCNLCLPDGNGNTARQSLLPHGSEGDCANLDCECREPKKSKKPKNLYADSRSSPKRHVGSKNFIRVTGKHARRQRESSAISSELNPPFIHSVRTMSLDDHLDLDNTTRVPGPKIYTTTTVPSAWSHHTESKQPLRIADLVVEDIGDPIDHYQRRAGHVIWSNGSSQAIWMDELSQKYSQELIEYYERTLSSKAQQQMSQYQSSQQGTPNSNSAQPDGNPYREPSPNHTQWPSQYSSNVVTNPGWGFSNINAPIHPYSGRFGMNGNNVGNINPGGKGYITPSTMSSNSQAGAQPGGAHKSNRHSSTAAVPRHTSFAGR